jgi:hypothetical protein
MKKYIKIDFVPYIGIGIGTQRTVSGRELLLFLPFMTFQITFKRIKS